jgi:hypothetical protein
MTNRKDPNDQDRQQPEATTAVADQPVAEAGENNPSFAERAQEKSYKPIPDPFGIASDNLAGVRLFESRKDRQMAIMFGEGRSEDKPTPEVLAKMKEAGYHWNPSQRVWTHPVRFETARTTRIEAERLYDQVRQMIREEKGIAEGPAVPF